jgi:hypothetical protein
MFVVKRDLDKRFKENSSPFKGEARRGMGATDPE